ncbi:MAG: gliding motility-associated C-terminal domain-containing protein [Bacteroidota bacterium]
MNALKLCSKLVFIVLLVSTKSLYAQPGCPSIDAGPNQTITCNTNCTDLTATVLETGATNTYSVSSIPYAPPYPYNSGTALLVHVDDTWGPVITLPFNFCFYGNTYNKIVAGSNGVITFDTTVAGGYCAYSYTASIPNTALFPNTIFGPYHDIDPSVSGSGNMYYAILGSYPCRTFVVSWDHIPMFSCNSLIATHQIVLYESTNVIEVYMLNKPTCTSWINGVACLGIQNSTGTIGITAPGRNTSQWTTSNEAWRFTPAGTPNYTITWWEGATQIGTGETINVCPNGTTNYMAQVDYDVCSGNNVIVTDNVTVTYNGSFVFTASPAQDTICSNESVQLNASPANSYAWLPATGLTCTNCANPVATPTTSTTYSVTGIDNLSGCTTTATVAIIVNSNSPPTIGSNGPICALDTLKLYTTGGTSYNWTGPNGFSSPMQNPMIINATPVATGTYSAIVTGAGGCTSSNTVNVTVNPNPVITPTATPAAICLGSSSSLSATSTVPGTLFEWMPGSLSGTPVTVSPTTTTTYTLTGTVASCTGSNTVTVTVNPIPTSNFTATSPICSLGNSVITYNGDGLPTATYNWNFDGGTATPSGGLQNYTVHWPTAGTYHITLAVTQNNCTSTITSQTLIISNVTLNASTTANVSCYGFANGTATVAATNGIAPYSYQWNTIPNQNTQTAGNLAPGTYIVTVTDSVLCSKTDTVVITQPSVLNAQMSAIHRVACFGGNNGSASVSVSGGTLPYTYTWSGGTSAGNSVTSLSFGNYTVTLTDNHGCDTTISFTINQPPLLALSLAETNETCINNCNGSITATVNGGTLPYTYHWNNLGSTTNAINNLCAGNYSITITDSNNCTIHDQTDIFTSTLLQATGYADPIYQSIDQDVNFHYSGSPASSYTWSFGDGTTATVQNPVHQYTTDGVYTVTITISSGAPDFCEDAGVITVTIYIPSSIQIPNIITPNGDGFNDEFMVKSIGIGTEEMVIYNRWGKKIFSWSEVGGTWNGKDGNTESADGTYFYVYTAKGRSDGKTYDVHGTVTVLK